MYQVETDSQGTTATTIAEFLRSEQWTRPAGFSRTTCALQRLHVQFHSNLRVPRVYVCDTFEAARRSIGYKRPRVDDGQRHKFQ